MKLLFYTSFFVGRQSLAETALQNAEKLEEVEQEIRDRETRIEFLRADVADLEAKLKQTRKVLVEAQDREGSNVLTVTCQMGNMFALVCKRH